MISERVKLRAEMASRLFARSGSPNTIGRDTTISHASAFGRLV
jgi:hypothetical protein